MDASPLTLGLLGVGVLLAWSAVSNTSPLDEVKAALGAKVAPRPLAAPTPKRSFAAPGGGQELGRPPMSSATNQKGQLWPSVDAYLKAAGLRVGPPTTGQTGGGRHAAGSLHYQDRARDYGRTSDYTAIARFLTPIASDPSGPIEELFGPGVSIKNGRHIPQVPGHGGHTHVGLKRGRSM